MLKRQSVFSRIFYLVLFTLGFMSQARSQCTAVIGTNINPVAGCEVLTVQFYDNSSAVVTRSWDFGDGSATSNAQNPTHSFNAGLGDTTYTVSLTIECSTGGSHTSTKTVTVYAKPNLDISQNKNTVCAITDSVCLSNLAPFNASNTYMWNFGDGTISTDYSTCKIYSTPGTYTVELTVTNEYGCVNTLSKEDFVDVIPVPNTAFSVSEYTGCDPFTVFLTNTTDTVGNNYSDWTWDYGDGSMQSKEFTSAPHTYLLPGKYDIYLGTTNSLGCSNFSTQTITVKPSPTADFEAATPVCGPEPSLVNYVGSSSDTAHFNWIFDGGVVLSGSDGGPYNISWKEPGIKSLALQVIDNNCSSESWEEVVVNPLAKVYLHISADFDTVCSGQEVTFTASPEHFLNYQFYVNDVLVKNSYENTFSDNSFSDRDRIYVKITDNNGCTELLSDTVNLSVLPTPVVAITSSIPNDTICLGEEVIFTASPSGYDEYAFFTGNEEMQTGTAESYSSSILEDGQFVYATAIQDGCLSEQSNIIKTTVKEELEAPQVNCGVTSINSVEFTWAEVEEAAGYEISLDGAPFAAPGGGYSSLNEIVNGLSEGDSVQIQVRAFDGSACGTGLTSAVKTCYAKDCNTISFDTDNNLVVCEDERVELEISNISPDDFSIRWNNGIPGLDSSYTFIASSSRSIPVSIVDSSQLLCPGYSREIFVEVIPKPVLSISSSAGDILCEGSETFIKASPGTYDNYIFFDNSRIIKDSPYSQAKIEDPQDGHYYFAIASKNGCYGSSDSVQLRVETPMNSPVINVSYSDPVSVTFSWNQVAGAIGYSISINNGDFEIPSSGINGTTHTVSGLSPGESVIAVVMALSDAVCGNSAISQPASGFAETCSEITYTLQHEYNVCEDDSVMLQIDELNLENFQITWGSNTPGTKVKQLLWPDADTTVHINIRNSDQAQCPSINDFINISVIERPEKLTLNSSAFNDSICRDDVVTLTASPTGYDLYTFYDGYKVIQSSTNNRYTSGDLRSGNIIRAEASNKQCTGDLSDAVRTVIMPRPGTPLVNCGSSTDSTVTFTWDAVNDALGYLISVDGESYEIPSGALSHTVEGLSAGQEVSASLIATGESPCGQSFVSNTALCSAIYCDDFTFTHEMYDTICAGETIDLYITDISISNYSISWNAGAMGTDTLLSFNGLSDSTVTVSLLDIDQPDCKAREKNFEITVHEIPVIQLESTAFEDTLCEGNELSFIVSPAGLDNYTFTYNSSSILQDSPLHILQMDTVTTGFELSVEALHNNCITQTVSRNTEVLPMPVLTLTSSASGTMCYGTDVDFTAAAGYDRYVFRDATKTILETDQNTATISVRSGVITVEAFNERGCGISSLDTIDFDLLPLPHTSTITSADLICPGEYVTVTVLPAGYPQYEYYINDSLVSSSDRNQYAFRIHSSDQEINIYTTDANGCRNIQDEAIQVTVKDFPKNTISSEVEGVCLGEYTELTAVFDQYMSTESFKWGNGSTDTTISVAPGAPRMYYLTSTANGCTVISDSIRLDVDRDPRPEAYAGEDYTICIFDSIQVIGSGGTSFHWSPEIYASDPDVADPYLRGDSTTAIVLTVTNRYCTDTDTLILTIDRCLDDITRPVPQIITPNGDDINDRWIISDIDYFTNNKVEVFNRWGNLVFSAESYDNSWMGTSARGQDLPEGTYYYVIDLGNGSEPRVGYLIIHR